MAERRSQLVLGIDPDPQRLWPGAHVTLDAKGSPAQRAATAVTAHCCSLIDAAGSVCVAVKLQLACFERLGVPGRAALGAVAAHAVAAGLLVIADGKRGDIAISAGAYAESLLGGTPTPYGDLAGLGADAITVNPLLGRDSLDPFIDAAGRTRAGLFVLVRTSNPGAADVQDAMLADGRPLWERLARLVDAAGAAWTEEGPLADVGAVVGATAPAHVARMRELMPRAVFLLPGVGAQGGRVEDLAPAFGPGPAGGLITASRSIAEAHRDSPGTDPAAAAHAAAEQLRDTAWTLSQPL